MGYWDCEYCGTKKIEGTTVDCPNCGHQRGKEVKFYMDMNNKVYVDNHKVKGPDWHCEFCNAYNPADSDKCENCGAPRGSKNYFDYNKDRQGVISKNGFEDDEHFRKEEDDKEVEEENTDNGVEDTNSEVEDATKYKNYDIDEYLGQRITRTGKSISRFFVDLFTSILEFIEYNVAGIFKGLLIALLIILSVVGIYNLVKPKWYKLEITNLRWESTVEIEELKTFREDDWSVPSGGRVVYTKEEVHHYEQVIDHYEEVQKSRTVPDGGHYETVTRTRTVPDGGHEEVVGYSDNGDGTFSEETRWVTEYTTETYTEEEWVQDYKTEYYYEQEPVYRDEPVYETKYYYDIDRWVYERSVVTSGYDKEPYYGELNLHSKEREKTRYTNYYVTGNILDKKEVKEKTYNISKEYWEQMESDKIINIKVSLGNIVEWNEE